MKRNDTVGFVAVDELNDGIVVKFCDGRCVLYSAALLYSMISEAELQDEELLLW